MAENEPAARAVAPPPAEFEVHMTYKFIYDMLLYQMYSTLAGFLMNLVGLTIIIMGARQLFRPDISAASAILYLILGIAVLAYTPINLRNRARQDMRQEKYRHPIRYIFDNSGIDEIMYDGFNHYGWDQVVKAVSTPKTISFYMGGGKDVLIFPKESFNDETFASAMYYLTHNVVMGKIFIR